MKIDSTKLPDDPQALKQIILALENKNNEIEHKLSAKNKDYDQLNEKYLLLHRRFWARKSEKLTKEDEQQMRLFNEAEQGAEDSDSEEHEISEQNIGAPQQSISVKPYIRRKCGRKALPADLPREIILHDLTDEEKSCEHCGKERPCIGTEQTEELEIIPPKIYVKQHQYRKYGACKCDECQASEKAEIVSAPFEKRMIPGGIASASLLAYVMISKFCDSLPFYRQSKIFERIDVGLSRATLCNWSIETNDRMALFFDVFTEYIKRGNFMRMDETTVQVLHEQGRASDSKSYMWVAIGYPLPARPLVLFQYHPTRGKNVPDDFLKDFSGYLQTDGYDGYNFAVENHKLIHVGCFAHARRYFFDAFEKTKKDKSSQAFFALSLIQKLYVIEDDLRGKSYDDETFVQKRKKETADVLDELHSWLEGINGTVVSTSLLAKAISYCLNEWSKLIRYLDLACMTPDNNESERTIRPFVIGRKNWLFSNTPRGAQASAAMYSLIESAKANRLEPYAYLRFLFTKLPYATDRETVTMLLPCFLSQDDIKL